jgi:sortase A
MKRKLLALLLVLVGLSFICYPTARDMYYEYQQRKITADWLANLEQLDTEPAQTSEENEASDKQPTPVIDLTKEMEGLLIIDKINLKVPILTGLSKRNLDLAVASVENTGKPGEEGNYIVAGHNSRTYGLLFNRLDELTLGDEIVVQCKDSSYTYEVTESVVVQPEEVQILLPEGGKKQITLVTCDYSTPKPYLRLIVKGELKN